MTIRVWHTPHGYQQPSTLKGGCWSLDQFKLSSVGVSSRSSHLFLRGSCQERSNRSYVDDLWICLIGCKQAAAQQNFRYNFSDDGFSYFRDQPWYQLQNSSAVEWGCCYVVVFDAVVVVVVFSCKSWVRPFYHPFNVMAVMAHAQGNPPGHTYIYLYMICDKDL